MTDWLSKIEARGQDAYFDELTLSIDHQQMQIDNKRMARVVRELAGYPKYVRHKPDEGQYASMVRREWRAYKNLSPDAKELLK